MTLKNRCVNCDHVIEAPDSMRGHEMACPKCEATNVLLSSTDARRREAEEHAISERERRRFMDTMGQGGGATHYGSGGWTAPAEPFANHDLALMAARRLKDTSVYLLFFAYLLLLLALGLGTALFLWAGLPGAWAPFAFGAGIFVGITLFIVFKLMSDTVRALADLTDLGRSLDERLSLVLRQTEVSAHKGATQQEDAAPGEILSQAG